MIVDFCQMKDKNMHTREEFRSENTTEAEKSTGIEWAAARASTSSTDIDSEDALRTFMTIELQLIIHRKINPLHSENKNENGFTVCDHNYAS